MTDVNIYDQVNKGTADRYIIDTSFPWINPLKLMRATREVKKSNVTTVNNMGNAVVNPVDKNTTDKNTVEK